MRHSEAQLREIANEFVDYEARSLAVIQLDAQSGVAPFMAAEIDWSLLSREMAEPSRSSFDLTAVAAGRARVVWALPANDGLAVFSYLSYWAA